MRRRERFVFDWPETDFAKVFAALADQPYALFFDSAQAGHPLNRFSYIVWQPFEIIALRYDERPFETLQERLAVFAQQFETGPSLPPFQGGAAGMFGYGLASAADTISLRHGNGPDMRIGLYDRVLALDHASGKATLIVHAEDEMAAIDVKSQLIANNTAPHRPVTLDWKTERSDEHYKDDIARVIEYIKAGDIFQANLSRRFTADLPSGFDRYAHYRVLRQVNAAPYGAFMNFGDMTLAGASPERFLSVEGRRVETRPIKGTGTDPAALAASEKDRAENIMIVDLLRNDLSKVCEDHSVTVEKLCAVESFAGLHHLVSTVSGILRDGLDPVDALKACFPGGSISGAPKFRAMQIIDALEPSPRGPYCGAIGWIGWDGAMDTAIAIRTLVYENGRVHLQTGGGITALSAPEAELEETQLKAEKILHSFRIN